MIESFEGKQGFSNTHILLIIFAFRYLIIFQHKELYSGFFVTLCNFGHISETCTIQKSGSAAPFFMLLHVLKTEFFFLLLSIGWFLLSLSFCSLYDHQVRRFPIIKPTQRKNAFLQLDFLSPEIHYMYDFIPVWCAHILGSLDFFLFTLYFCYLNCLFFCWLGQILS